MKPKASKPNAVHKDVHTAVIKKRSVSEGEDVPKKKKRWSRQEKRRQKERSSGQKAKSVLQNISQGLSAKNQTEATLKKNNLEKHLKKSFGNGATVDALEKVVLKTVEDTEAQLAEPVVSSEQPAFNFGCDKNSWNATLGGKSNTELKDWIDANGGKEKRHCLNANSMERLMRLAIGMQQGMQQGKAYSSSTDGDGPTGASRTCKNGRRGKAFRLNLLNTVFISIFFLICFLPNPVAAVGPEAGSAGSADALLVLAMSALSTLAAAALSSEDEDEDAEEQSVSSSSTDELSPPQGEELEDPLSSSSAFSSIPTTLSVFAAQSANASMESSEADCTICLDKMNADDSALFNCGHLFHIGCVNKLLQADAGATCPVCRQVIAILMVNGKFAVAKEQKLSSPAVEDSSAEFVFASTGEPPAMPAVQVPVFGEGVEVQEHPVSFAEWKSMEQFNSRSKRRAWARDNRTTIWEPAENDVPGLETISLSTVNGNSDDYSIYYRWLYLSFPAHYEESDDDSSSDEEGEQQQQQQQPSL